MMEYTIEYDSFEGCFTEWYETNDFWDVVEEAKAGLEENGGGHADIFNENGDFVDDVEV